MPVEILSKCNPNSIKFVCNRSNNGELCTVHDHGVCCNNHYAWFVCVLSISWTCLYCFPNTLKLKSSFLFFFLICPGFFSLKKEPWRSCFNTTAGKITRASLSQWKGSHQLQRNLCGKRTDHHHSQAIKASQ